MSRPNITLPDEIAEPMFCKEPDDFALMTLQIIKSTYAASDEDPDMFLSFLTLSVKIICHEYLACVLSGTVQPYDFDDAFTESEYQDFRKVILEAKEEALKAGVPMIEKNGKYVLNVEELTKRARIMRRKDGES